MSTAPVPLVIAAHGTRDADGEAEAHALVRRVAARLPDVPVRVGFIELSTPPLGEALEDAAQAVDHAGGGELAVVPLMLGEAGHAKDDIPDAIREAAAVHPRVHLNYARVLGPHDDLLRAVRARVDAALGGDPAQGTVVVLVGRGSSDSAGNAGLAATARLLYETGGYDSVEISFIAVAQPSIGGALTRAVRLGAQRVIVAPYVLFAGLMRSSVVEQVAQWRAGADESVYRTPEEAPARGEATLPVPGGATPERADIDIRVAEVIGDCDLLGDVVIERYTQAVASAPARHPAQPGELGVPDPDLPFVPYPAGLRLDGRRVLVVGGGPVARRRVAGLLAVGAIVTVIAPDVVPELAGRAASGEIAWHNRRFRPSDLNDVWYVVACADDRAVDAQVADSAQERHIFCVRADDATKATAWTPAVGHHGELTIAVLANRHPHTSRGVRDQIMTRLADGSITADPVGPRRHGA